jgi:proteasome-associated ATPase
MIQQELIIGLVPKELQKKEREQLIQLASWEQIGGLGKQLKEIREKISLMLKHRKAAEAHGIKPSAGILLYGPPGCGKTLIAKAIAREIIGSDNVNKKAFIYVKGPEFLSEFVGLAERRIRETFTRAREYMEDTDKQSVIFIDEADAILNKRGSRMSSDVDKTIVAQFLSEMDGFYKHKPFIILATNYHTSLDDAVIRPGRIDNKFEITRPSLADTNEIAKIYLNNSKCAVNVDLLSKKVSETIFASPLKNSVSGALIENVVNISSQKAFMRSLEDTKAKGIIENDIEVAINSLNQ